MTTFEHPLDFLIGNFKNCFLIGVIAGFFHLNWEYYFGTLTKNLYCMPNGLYYRIDSRTLPESSKTLNRVIEVNT